MCLQMVKKPDTDTDSCVDEQQGLKRIHHSGGDVAPPIPCLPTTPKSMRASRCRAITQRFDSNIAFRIAALVL